MTHNQGFVHCQAQLIDISRPSSAGVMQLFDISRQLSTIAISHLLLAILRHRSPDYYVASVLSLSYTKEDKNAVETNHLS